jgi:HD domain
MPTETAMTRTEDHLAEAAGPLSTEPWVRLARYRDELDAASGLGPQISATLRAARLECRADAAVWYCATRTESALVDAADPDTGWAIEVARLAIASSGPEAPAGTWVPTDPPLSLHPAPTTAAFARLRPARLGCLLVVSARPNHVFSREAQAALRYFARTLTLHHQHEVTASGLRSTLTGVFKSLVALLDVRDPYMTGHGERVGRIARRIGEEMGLSTAVASDLYLAGLLHDVGTLGVPDEVLHHPGKLTGEEMAQMRRHVLIGDELLASAKHVERLRPGVRNHHERWETPATPSCQPGGTGRHSDRRKSRRSSGGSPAPNGTPAWWTRFSRAATISSRRFTRRG